MKNKSFSKRQVCAATFLAVMFCRAQLLAQTNSETTNAPLKLLPPLDELPPTFWEQNESAILFAGFGSIALVAFGLCFIFRSKPKTINSPEAQAREALENLRQQPEDGAVLSRVSQVVRNYFSAAFQLTPGELTTTEFILEISTNGKIAAELSTAAANLLRESDARKFSTSANSVKLDAVNRALALVEQAEQRRAQFRQMTKTQTRGRRA
jgi:hypothetical protein